MRHELRDGDIISIAPEFLEAYKNKGRGTITLVPDLSLGSFVFRVELVVKEDDAG